MNTSLRKKLARGKRKNSYRLRDIEWEDQPAPMFSGRNMKYALADKTRGLACGGIGAIHMLARRSELINAIDRRLHLLKVHKPYHESDHVLNSDGDVCHSLQSLVKVAGVDIDVDSDNDGLVEESDDDIEENSPGRLLHVNNDFDEGKIDPVTLDPVADNADASPVHEDGASIVIDDLAPIPHSMYPMEDDFISNSLIFVHKIGGSGAVRILALRPAPLPPFDDDWVEVVLGANLRDDFFLSAGPYRNFNWWVEGLTPGEVTLEFRMWKSPTDIWTDKIVLTVLRAELDPVTSGTSPVPINPAIVAPVKVGLDDLTIFTEGNTFELTSSDPNLDLTALPVSWQFVLTGGSINPNASLITHLDQRGAQMDFPLPSFGNLGSGRIDFIIGALQFASIDTLVRNIQPDLEPDDFRFQVKAHLCQDSSGLGTARTSQEIKTLMSDVTKVLSQAGVIVTTSQVVTTVVETHYVDDLSSGPEKWGLFGYDEDETAIDIYFVIQVDSGNTSGITSSPANSGPLLESGIAIADTTLDGPLQGGEAVRTLAHEIVHYLLNQENGELDHRSSPENLMYGATNDSKRDLDESQCLDIRSNHGVD